MKETNVLSHINLFTFLIIKFLQKSYDISKKFHFPKYLIQISYEVYFKSMRHVLIPYLNQALVNVKQNYIGDYNSNVIWIFWWQGYKYMPLIVKRCFNSVKNHANGHKVILITKNNIKNYIDIPNYIYCKVQKGYITLTHFSDILRFNLLNKYGGLWCDATLYCTSNLNKSYFNYLYTSGGYKGTLPKFVNGRWTGFLIGGNSHNALFQFMCNYFNLYWKYNKYQIAYFLIDLGLHYAYIHNIGDFGFYDDNIACYHNPNMFSLVNLLNRHYDQNKYRQIITDTNMFKLTYKSEFNDYKNTFYNRLIDKYK